ncbi:YwmB family TATA-box binding protein [Paenibacillus sp. YYML68]|uniref:YwmB family TATA-box binding protein n=1 Tax=Paenibacillus sp. YYML68 TaxID=2909250 RepID=UPI002492B489|nr:YwmB family TATA-box binding protein [Paenibacillus sp. YYML68]
MTKRSMMAAVLAMVLVISVWAAVQVQASARAEGAHEDTKKLLAAAREAFGQDAAVRLTLKKTGPIQVNDMEHVGGLLLLGEKWGEQLGLTAAGEGGEQSGHPVYRQSGALTEELRGCMQTLLLTELQPGELYGIVKLECESFPLERSDAVVALQARVDEAMAGLGWQASWNVMIQGELDGRELERGQEPEHGQEHKQEHEAEAILGAVAAKLGGSELERYEDVGTVSVSYGSQELRGYASSGANKLSFQTAQHRDSRTGKSRLTIGAPLITTEY